MPACMTLVEFVELAAVLADQAPLVIRSRRPIAVHALTQYWSAAKCRQERWSRSLKLLHEPSPESPPPELHSTATGDGRIRSVLEEILVTEVVTRVFTAVLTAHDRRRETSDAEPIGRSVLGGHLEARHRALSLLMYGPGVAAQDAVDLNRLRRQAERWNDLLIGKLLLGDDVAEFAIDPELAREFAADFRGDSSWQAGGTAWSVATASLRSGFRAVVSQRRADDDNEQIAAAILGCLGADLFDSIGMPRSLWGVRLMQAADSAQGMIDELFATDGTTVAGGISRPRCASRYRR